MKMHKGRSIGYAGTERDGGVLEQKRMVEKVYSDTLKLKYFFF